MKEKPDEGIATPCGSSAQNLLKKIVIFQPPPKEACQRRCTCEFLLPFLAKPNTKISLHFHSLFLILLHKIERNKHSRRHLLLPQVWREQSGSLETFLTYCNQL